MTFTTMFIPSSRQHNLWVTANKDKGLDSLCAEHERQGNPGLTAYMHRDDAINAMRKRTVAVPELLVISFAETWHKMLVKEELLSGNWFEPHTGARLWILKRAGCKQILAAAEVKGQAVEAAQLQGLSRPPHPLERTTLYVPLPDFQAQWFVVDTQRATERTFGYKAIGVIHNEVHFIEGVSGFQTRAGAIKSWISSGRTKPHTAIALLHIVVDFDTLIALMRMKDNDKNVISGSAMESTTREPLGWISRQAFDLLFGRAKFYIEHVSKMLPDNQGTRQQVYPVKPEIK